MPNASPQSPPVDDETYIGLSPEDFEKRREEMRKGWDKLNPGKVYPEKMFDAIWLQMDRNDRVSNPRTRVLELLVLDDGQKVYCAFTSDRTYADLYNRQGSKIAEWINRPRMSACTRSVLIPTPPQPAPELAAATGITKPLGGFDLNRKDEK